SPAPATATPAVPVPEGAAPQTGTPPVAAVPGVPAVPASDSVPHGQRAAGSQGTPVSTEG
ncbi:phosphopeptide-binding protein, partial [Mycobacteroides abscessus]